MVYIYIKELTKKIPIIYSLISPIWNLLSKKFLKFNNSTAYWINRYRLGGNSGAGSYGRMAEFKAYIINSFVKDNKIDSVIDFGCGDGNQLKSFKFPNYIGYDVSSRALSLCRKTFKNDNMKKFKKFNEYEGEFADLALSLDVIFHLVEDEVFENYMNVLFSSSKKFVIIYSSNIDVNNNRPQHIKHRNFSKWVKNNKFDWKLANHIPNKYSNSIVDFFIYKKICD